MSHICNGNLTEDASKHPLSILTAPQYLSSPVCLHFTIFSFFSQYLMHLLGTFSNSYLPFPPLWVLFSILPNYIYFKVNPFTKSDSPHDSSLLLLLPVLTSKHTRFIAHGATSKIFIDKRHRLNFDSAINYFTFWENSFFFSFLLLCMTDILKPKILYKVNKVSDEDLFILWIIFEWEI